MIKITESISKPLSLRVTKTNYGYLVRYDKTDRTLGTKITNFLNKEKGIVGVLSAPGNKEVWTDVPEKAFIDKLMKVLPDYVIYKGDVGQTTYN